jgi:hypothetical protein
MIFAKKEEPMRVWQEILSLCAALGLMAPILACGNSDQTSDMLAEAKLTNENPGALESGFEEERPSLDDYASIGSNPEGAKLDDEPESGGK